MKLLVVSDTHLQNDLFEAITNRYQDMDFYIHCGDSSLSKEDYRLNNYLTVKGNHDDAPFPFELNFQAGNLNCLIVHGQNHDVYHGENTIYQYMQNNNIDLCFHGHTHIPTLSIIEGKYIINPGSVMINRGSYGFGTYAIVQIDGKHINVEYYNSQTHEPCSELVLADGLIYLAEIKELLQEYENGSHNE